MNKHISEEVDFTEKEQQFDLFSDMCEDGGCGL